MRLSPNGLDLVYVAGRGENPRRVMVSVRVWGGTDKAIADGHSPCFAHADAVVFGPQEDGLLHVAERRTNWQAARLDMPSGNSVAAGSSRVAVHRTDPRRVLTLEDRVISNGMDVAISDNGVWLAYALADLVPDGSGGYRHQDGVSTLVVERYDGTGDKRDLWVGAPTSPRFGGTTLAWETGGGAIAYVVDVNNPSSPVQDLRDRLEGWLIYKPVPVWHQRRGQLRFLLSADEGECSRVDLVTEDSLNAGEPFGKSFGWSSGSAYQHDCRPLDRGWRVIYYTPEGTVSDHTWDGEQGDVALSPPGDDGDQWPADGPRVTERVGWLTWFYATGRYGDFFPHQNAALTSAEFYSDNGFIPDWADECVAEAVKAEGAAFIGVSDIAYAKPFWSKVVGIMIHEAGSPEQIKAAVAEANATMDTFGLPRRQCIAIITPEEAVNPAFARCADAIAPEIYLDAPGDSWEATQARAVDLVAHMLQALPGTPLYLIPQAYDRNNQAWKDKPSHLSAIAQACFDALAIERVVGLWPFAYARPGGATTYPQLEDWYTAQADALTTPVLPVDPEEPVDPEDEDMTPEQVAAFMRANPVPSDINTEAYLDFRSKVWLRDQIAEPNGTPIITRGALTIYYDPYFNSEVAAQLSQFGAPSGPPEQYAATWRRYAAAGVSRAINVYKHGDPSRGLAGQPPGAEDPQ